MHFVLTLPLLLFFWQALQLRDNLIRDAQDGATLFSANQSFVVGPPLVTTRPIASVAASSPRVGRCDDLVLNAGGSSGGGGRSMAYVF